MICSRINLRRTVKDELLFSALVETSAFYSISVNDKNERIPLGGRAEFTINANKEGRVFNLSISTRMKTSTTRKVRLNVMLKNSQPSIETMVIVTVDNPYRVTTDGAGRYIIVHEQAVEREAIKEVVENGVDELAST